MSRHVPEVAHVDSGEETRRYAVLDCEGGMASTGLVLTRGPDDLLTVARVYPGGTAEGILLPGDVILACSLVVMVEKDDGEFVPEFRWHDATESSAEHALGILMTHDGELRVRVCRNYQPRMERAVRAAWKELVPTSVARSVRETWSRLLYREKPRKPRAAKDAEPDVTIGGIWKGLFTAGSGRDVRGDARRCWAEVLNESSTEKEEKEDERLEEKTPEVHEVVCVVADVVADAEDAEAEAEAEAEADAVAVAVADAPVADRGEAAREVRVQEEDVEVEVAEEAHGSTKTWEEFEVSLDCTAGVNMTGLQFAQREDGLLRVSVCKPGGTASKKVKLGDILLATTYVVMIPDPTGAKNVGIPTLEWMDAVHEGHSFNTLQEAMMTHSQEMRFKLARGDVPLGALGKDFQSLGLDSVSEPAETPEAEAERRYREAENAREMAKRSMRAAASAGAAVPDDIKAWAAKIAAEARAARGA
jgi:hypothetical protein